jgi:hypothetical protein
MAAPPVGDKLFKRGESRLFSTVWLAMHLTDAMAMASLAVRGNLNMNNDKQGMCSICGAFPLEIIFPIVHPMKLTVSNTKIDEIILEIKTKGTTPIPGEHNVAEFPGMYNRVISLVYLRFYEEHRPHIQSKYGGDAKAWPQIFQFAWTIRNGIVHHGGNINFSNPNYPSVTWHTFSYSPADNGKPIFGSHFTVGDLFMFLFDFSDELDAISAPFPID